MEGVEIRPRISEGVSICRSVHLLIDVSFCLLISLVDFYRMSMHRWRLALFSLLSSDLRRLCHNGALYIFIKKKKEDKMVDVKEPTFAILPINT